MPEKDGDRFNTCLSSSRKGGECNILDPPDLPKLNAKPVQPERRRCDHLR